MSTSDLNNDLDGTQSGLSRRTLVRAGANAAWAVPLISVATAAPALAVSQAPKFAITLSGAQRISDMVRLDARVTNIGTGPSTLPISLVIAMDPSPENFYTLRPFTGWHLGLGWRNPSKGGPAAGPWTWTFKNTAPLKVGASSQTMTFFIGVGKNSNGLLSITGTVPPQPQQPGAAHFTFGVISSEYSGTTPKTVDL